MRKSDGARRGPESSVATKIILLVFLATFVSAAAVSWISIETARRQFWSQVHQSYPAALARTGQRLLRWLAEGRGLAADLATRHASRETLLVLVREASAPGRREAATGLFRGLVSPLAERSQTIEGFALIGLDGRPIFESTAGPALSPPQRQRLAGADSALVQDFLVPGSGALVATSVPVRSAEGAPVALLVASFRPDGLRDILASDRLAAEARIELLDASGQVLLRSGSPDEGTAAPVLPASLPLGAVREYTSVGGEHVIAMARPVGALGWTLVVEAPYERAFAPVRTVIRRLLLIDVCVVVLASLLAYAITASIVRPIEALSEGARRIASGRLDLELPETGRQDEIGFLTRTFNEMVRRLQHTQADLEAANHRLRHQNQNLQASNEVLEQLSITDGLTKLHNHRFFQDHLIREIKRANRTGEPLSLVLVDIDDFKRLNDRLGHAAGDELLQRIARVLAESVRDSDLLARYGGEEFAVVASGTDLAGAIVLAEKLRGEVAAVSFSLEDSVRPVSVTVSSGVAEYKGDRKKLFQSADRALYRAKAEGKNRVRIGD